MHLIENFEYTNSSNALLGFVDKGVITNQMENITVSFLSNPGRRFRRPDREGTYRKETEKTLDPA